jgi:hypothetical protein
LQILKAAQVKVAQANCIFAGLCAPQVFVYSPGMFSSSNQDFVRGTVSSFYEMFQQVSQRRSAEDTEEDDFRAFVFNSSNPDSEDSMVCPMDNMEWELKVRNQAMKKGCASVQMDGLKKALFMVRIVVDTIVQVVYMILQIVIALFRLIIPMNGENEFGQIVAELEFWFNKLIIIMVELIKQLANMLFNLIFSTGPLGSVMKTIVMWLCKLMQFILEIWNATGVYVRVTPHFCRVIHNCFNHTSKPECSIYPRLVFITLQNQSAPYIPDDNIVADTCDLNAFCILPRK